MQLNGLTLRKCKISFSTAIYQIRCTETSKTIIYTLHEKLSNGFWEIKINLLNEKCY